MRSKNEACGQRLQVGGSLAVAPVAKVVARSTGARRSVRSISEMEWCALAGSKRPGVMEMGWVRCRRCRGEGERGPPLETRRRGQRGNTKTLARQACARPTRVAEQRAARQILSRRVFQSPETTRRTKDAANNTNCALATATAAAAATLAPAPAPILHPQRCLLLLLHLHPAMNLSLVDPFVLAQDCPDVITGRLRECCASPRPWRRMHCDSHNSRQRPLHLDSIQPPRRSACIWASTFQLRPFSPRPSNIQPSTMALSSSSTSKQMALHGNCAATRARSSH
jgi:hypothetical protein